MSEEDSIFQRIKLLRGMLGQTQKEFAEKINIKQSQVANWERRTEGRLQQKSIDKIVETFSVNERWLTIGVGEVFVDDKVLEFSVLASRVFGYIERHEHPESKEYEKLHQSICQLLWRRDNLPPDYEFEEKEEKMTLEMLKEYFELFPTHHTLRAERIVFLWQEHLAPAYKEYRLRSGRATDGEIEVLRWEHRGDLIPSDSPVKRYVSVYIDKVLFWGGEFEEGKPKVAEGEFVRIETPGLEVAKEPTYSKRIGSVFLPIDRDSGACMLVVQYRHTMQEFVSELPRGFGDFLDKFPGDSSKEHISVDSSANDYEEIRLGRVKPDSGKITDVVDCKLVFVDREKQDNRMREDVKAMENPVWVSLRDFYRAVICNEPITVGYRDYLKRDFERKGFKQSPLIQHNELHIQCGFTIQAAMLALPILSKRYSKALRLEALLEEVAQAKT